MADWITVDDDDDEDEELMVVEADQTGGGGAVCGRRVTTMGLSCGGLTNNYNNYIITVRHNWVQLVVGQSETDKWCEKWWATSLLFNLIN